MFKLDAGQAVVVGGDYLPLTQSGVAAGALAVSAGLSPVLWEPSNAGRSGW